MRSEYLGCAVVVNSVGCFDLTRKKVFLLSGCATWNVFPCFCLVTFYVGMVI